MTVSNKTEAATKAAPQSPATPLIEGGPNFIPDNVQILPVDQQLHFYWDATVQWLSHHTLAILIALTVGVAIYFALNTLRSIASRRADKMEDQASLSYIGFKALARTSQFFILMVPLKLLSRFAGAPTVVDTTINFLFTVAAVFQVAIWLREIVLGFIQRRAATGESSEHETLTNAMGLIRLLITVALFGIAAIMVLDNLGVNVTGLVAGLGIGGIAIGLAAQGIFSDLFAALSIIFDKPFRKGDTVQYDATTATVEKIGLKSTRLRALSGEQKIISNTNLLGKEITNLTRLYRRRVQFLLSLTYHTDPAKAKALPDICKKVVEEAGHEYVRCAFLTFAPSSLDFELLFEVVSDDLAHVADEKGRVGLMLWEEFARQGLAFAYPTQTTYTAAPDGTLVMPYATPGESKKT